MVKPAYIILECSQTWVKSNLKKRKIKFTKKKLGSKFFFASNKVYIDPTTTISLIEV